MDLADIGDSLQGDVFEVGFGGTFSGASIIVAEIAFNNVGRSSEVDPDTEGGRSSVVLATGADVSCVQRLIDNALQGIDTFLGIGQGPY